MQGPTGPEPLGFGLAGSHSAHRQSLPFTLQRVKEKLHVTERMHSVTSASSSVYWSGAAEGGGMREGKDKNEGGGSKMDPLSSLTYKWNSAVEKESVL